MTVLLFLVNGKQAIKEARNYRLCENLAICWPVEENARIARYGHFSYALYPR
jgi:hypothetical protein